MKETKVAKSITINKTVADEIEKLGIEEQRNFSNMVNKILQEYLQKNDNK